VKKINLLIVGSGVLGAYLAVELIKRGQNIIVTSRSSKGFHNYKYLKLRKKGTFKKLNLKPKMF
tara:strand:- start:238 stop:429 length:192 start_codon:yes stop_codon:yes gene_type:complete